MEAEQFDAIARARSGGLPRRGVLARFLSGLIPALSIALVDDAQAKKRKNNKKNKGNGLNCGAGTVQCGNQCLGPCPGTQVLDPVACTCCVPNDTGCPAPPGACCSGTCQPGGAGPICVGRGNGAQCQFNAQCASGKCNDVCVS
jgi:hypothetical protein